MPGKIVYGDARELAPRVTGPIRAIITDPPYGMGYKSNRAETEEGQRWSRTIEGDQDLATAIELFADVVPVLVKATCDDADLYVFCRWDSINAWQDTINACCAPFAVKQCIVWDKILWGLGDMKGSWANSHEMILYAKKGRWLHPSRVTNVIHCERLQSNQMWHPTQKPVPLFEKIIRQSSAEGDLIVDPFCGSGASIKAAQNLGRRGLGFEVDAEHARRAIESLNEVTFAQLDQP